MRARRPPPRSSRILKKQGRAPLLIACDLQRPAAIEQLATLGRQIEVPVYIPAAGRKGCEPRGRRARLGEEQTGNVQIFDTAGRQEIDAALIEKSSSSRNS